MVTIEDVFELIKQERKYQKHKWGELHDENQSFEGFLLVIEGEMKEAKDGWLKDGQGRNMSIHEVLQTATVAIACLEYHLDGQYLPRMHRLSTPQED